MNTEKLQIVKIDRKSGISAKNNKPYTLTKVQDGFTGRQGAAFGDWADGWKIGDEIDVIWTENGEYKGVKQWSIENPNQKARSSSTSTSAPATTSAPVQSSAVIAYQIAADLAPLFFDAKKTKLTEVTKLAVAVQKEIESMEPSQVSTTAPKAKESVPKPDQSSDDLEEDLDEEDDDTLF